MSQSDFTTQQFPSEYFVESCGAVLFDLSYPQGKQVCLINLTAKNQWILAKGRRNINEPRRAAALREVQEETGFPCKLLPVTMPTRACTAAGPTDASDEPRVLENLTEPFMCTVKHLLDGKSIKTIWWYVAVLDGDARDYRGRGEVELFQAEFFPYEEAVEKLHFEDDRNVLRRAIRLVEATVTKHNQVV
jgi:8-oxo-dGTP pyrophosphatase MutT (NUDIX family)